MTETTAIRIERTGPPEAFVDRRVPLRPLGPADLHLRITAVGVNFADLMMRAGIYDTIPKGPVSPGFEVAGEVRETGTDVDRWRPGDRCVALMRYGGYAHDVILPASDVFEYPASLSPAVAASVPVAFLTAWVCLFDAAKAEENESVLVLTAAGGVGTAAVQLAVQRGLRVVGTAGTDRKRRFVTEELGAEACFDAYGPWEHGVRELLGHRGLDIALDARGGLATRSCRRLLGPLGRLVFFGFASAVPGQRLNWLQAAKAWMQTRPFHPLSLIQPNLGVFGVHLLHLGRKERVLRRAMPEIYRLMETGEIKPTLDRTFPLTRDGAVAAHRYIHERKNIGKVVLERDPETG
jgi:NADPH:quinone reductase-like Zn-dependent oxidoreductase